MLKKFFEIVLPKYLNEYYQTNLEQKNKITNFKNTVKTIKSIKAKNGILKWINKKNKIISELKKSKTKKSPLRGINKILFHLNQIKPSFFHWYIGII